MQLHSITVGSGARHVGLIHGLGADGTTWQPFIERMLATNRYTVTTVDLRGHGRSERADSYSLDDLADDVAESLPTGLHSVVGHSLGGSVLVRAVGRLQPDRAVYLDPGFGLSLPTAGIAGRAFWAVPALTLGVVGLMKARRSAAVKASYSPEVRALLKDSNARFDSKMAVGVFRDVAFHRLAVGAPDVPSTIVLSDESPSVLPPGMVSGLQTAGWDIRRLTGVHHDMQLESPHRTFELLQDIL